jgi:succinoglycan biosynthesis transport protein ExoP
MLNTAGSSRITSLRDIANVFSKRKWLVVIPLVLVSLIGWGGSYLMTPEYESFAIVSIDTRVQLSSALTGLLGIDQRYTGYGNRQADELRGVFNELISSYYVSQLSEQLKLGDDPKLTEKARKVAAVQPNMTLDQIKIIMLQDELADRVRVGLAAEDQVKITVQHPSQSLARDVANTLGEIFITERQKQEMASIRSSQNFSDVQLQKYEKQLQDKIAEKTSFETGVMRSQLDAAIISPTNRAEIRAEIDRTGNDVEEYFRAEKDALTNLEQKSSLPLDRLTVRESKPLKDARNELSQQLAQIGPLMTRYAWNDPQIINFKLKQSSLMSTIEQENRRLTSDQYGNQTEEVRAQLIALFNARANSDHATAKKVNLQAAFDQLVNKVSVGPEYQARLDRLNREIAQLTELRDRFRSQQESSTISQALLQDVSASKYRIVEPAKVALQPFKPNRTKIIAMAVVLGFALGLGAALLAEFMDTSFKKVEEIQSHLGLPVLGVAPRIEFLKRVLTK